MIDGRPDRSYGVFPPFLGNGNSPIELPGNAADHGRMAMLVWVGSAKRR
jgi:hypothetical protein